MINQPALAVFAKPPSAAGSSVCVDTCSLLLREELPVKDGSNITATGGCLMSLAGDNPRKNHLLAFPAVPACHVHGTARC